MKTRSEALGNDVLEARERLKLLAEQATSGDWFVSEDDLLIYSVVDDEVVSVETNGLGFDNCEDREFCAAANPDAVLSLLNALSEAEGREAAYRERLEITTAYQMGEDGVLVPVPAPEGFPDGIECRDDTITLLNARAEAAESRLSDQTAEIERLREALRKVKQELLIPAAEYVPAIPACWDIIDAALSPQPPALETDQP